MGAGPALPAWRLQTRVQGNSWAVRLLTDDGGQEKHKETPGKEDVAPQTEANSAGKRDTIHREAKLREE